MEALWCSGRFQPERTFSKFAQSRFLALQKSDAASLKVRLLKPDDQDDDEDDKKDISVYDFDMEEKKDVTVSPIGAKTSVLPSPTKSPGRSPSTHPLSPRVSACNITALCVVCGRIVILSNFCRCLRILTHFTLRFCRPSVRQLRQIHPVSN